MGQTLSEPITTKLSSTCENTKFRVGSSSMQGWRVTMEDAHTHILELPDDIDAAFFAVYDGHGGAAISKHAAANLHKFILQRSEYKIGDIPTAFKNAFLEFDEVMQNDEKLKNEICGTTAITCLIKGDKLYCGNVGDSRAIACIDGKCVPLSFDHKPSNPNEEARIRQAGGWIEFNRVNGNLALSRALGDFSFKRNPNKSAEEQMVCALPDVVEKTIDTTWEFVLICCDGIYDVLTNEEACELVRHRLGNGAEPQKVCESLLQTCLAPDCQMGGLGCDNMTAILICFLHGQSWSSYCSKIANDLSSSKIDFQSRLHGFSAVDSSSDEDSVILPEKTMEAKSVAESLYLTMSKRATCIASKASKTLGVDADQLKEVMEFNEYICKGTSTEDDYQLSNPAVEIANSADLLGGLNDEILTENYDSPAASQRLDDPAKSKSNVVSSTSEEN